MKKERGMLLSWLLPTIVVIGTQVCGAQELVWPSGKVLLLGWQAEGFSAQFLFGFWFSLKVMVRGCCLLTLILMAVIAVHIKLNQLMSHFGGDTDTV